MARLCSAFAVLLATAHAVTPIEKVTSLLEDLQKDIENEGKEEATGYEKFSCFCKDKTEKKSKSIEEAQDKVDSLNADIGKKTATRKDKIEEKEKEMQKLEETERKLQEAKEQYQKDKATYEATNADLTKAVNSAKRAHKVLSESDKSAAFLDLGTKSDVQNCLDLAEALNLISADKHEDATSFLQVDPSDPAYKFHSDKILKIIKDLQGDFEDERKKVRDEWKKTDEAFKQEKKDMEDMIDTSEKKIKKLTGEIGKLKSQIAKLNEDLVSTTADLEDDSVYLKDLTVRCEEKANAWDARTVTRHEEVEAIKKALKILTGDKVKDADKTNKRALLIHHTTATLPAKAEPMKTPPVNSAPLVKTAAPVKVTAPEKAAAPVKTAAPVKVEAPEQTATPVKTTATVKTAAPVKAAVPVNEPKPADVKQVKPSQAKAVAEVKPTTKKSVSFLQASMSRRAEDRALAILREASVHLGSKMLSSVVAQIEADPFVKIKKLIQGLIERLLEESKAEASKKGFCDTELGKSYEDRKNRFSDVNQLDADLMELEAHKQFLEDEIDQLTEDLKNLREDLKEATELRDKEKEDNEKTIKAAKEGTVAVGEAIEILKEFYKGAAKAKLLLQVSASPIEEDDPGAGFEGAYRGDQSSSKGIIGLLEVIKSDFERTDRKTTAEEAKAHEEYILFERTSKSDIAAKDTKKSLDEQDLDSTKSAIEQAYKDLKTATKLLDSALLNIEDLKPVCIDTGMSYAERVEKREEEIKALESALKALQPK
jgi:hypothetical protein